MDACAASQSDDFAEGLLSLDFFSELLLLASLDLESLDLDSLAGLSALAPFL